MWRGVVKYCFPGGTHKKQSSTYRGIMTSKEKKICHSEEDVSLAIIKLFENAHSNWIKSEGELFVVGLSGGSMVQQMGRAFRSPLMKFDDYEKWRFAFADERCEPFDSADSTFGQYRKEFEKNPQTKTLLQYFVPINESKINDLDACATDYEEVLFKICSKDKFPIMDLLFLGVGPDGHTCSLFRKHAALQEKDLSVTWLDDSPKPPPRRITITVPVINSARNVVFIITGESKAEVARQLLEERNPDPIPATYVSPIIGTLTFLLDDESASKLSEENMFSDASMQRQAE